jgi:hypothetical protein
MQPGAGSGSVRKTRNRNRGAAAKGAETSKSVLGRRYVAGEVYKINARGDVAFEKYSGPYPTSIFA